jgi:hypothetical protein
MIFTGGCYCGAIRYRSELNPVETAYCHCSICRRTTGAPLLAFASFPTDGFTYTKGTPAIFNSSSHGQREFCSTCGTQICFRTTETADMVDVSSGSLDELDSVAPTHHIYVADQVSWLKLADQLPRHDEDCKR